jgi:hypothetical protein
LYGSSARLPAQRPSIFNTRCPGYDDFRVNWITFQAVALSQVPAGPNIVQMNANVLDNAGVLVDTRYFRPTEVPFTRKSNKGAADSELDAEGEFRGPRPDDSASDRV